MEPTFVGIGVQKCGTSSVANYLRASGADIPRKELHYFIGAKEPSRAGYLNEFAHCDKTKVFGEFTPDYVFYSEQLNKLSNYLSTSKFLIVLRNPIDRFYSALNHGRGKGAIPPHWSAKKVFDYVLSGQTMEHWLQTPIWKGYYGEHLDRAFRLLPQDRSFVFFLEEIHGSGAGEENRRRLLDFVGLDSTYASSALPKVNKARNNLKLIPPISRDPHVDSALAELYSPSMEKLSSILGRELPWHF